jgi:biotin carboxyl carrier protein
LIYDVLLDGQTLRVEVRSEDARYRVTLDGRTLDVDYRELGGGFASLLIEGRSYEVGVSRRGNAFRVAFPDDEVLLDLGPASRGGLAAPRAADAGPARILAPMPGKVVRLLVEPGEQVQEDQGLVVVEAMKMENELRAPRAGRVRETPVREGQAVEMGAVLVVVE